MKSEWPAAWQEPRPEMAKRCKPGDSRVSLRRNVRPAYSRPNPTYTYLCTIKLKPPRNSQPAAGSPSQPRPPGNRPPYSTGRAFRVFCVFRGSPKPQYPDANDTTLCLFRFASDAIHVSELIGMRQSCACVHEHSGQCREWNAVQDGGNQSDAQQQKHAMP